MELLGFSNWTTRTPQTAFNESELWFYIAEFRAVCIVIQKNPSLHSATHYFLFNLAVADILLLLFGE
ncbi:hypothetical protein WA026_012386 [Henosepilachna vigintioctopunctata]|uniref:G-protein coupled receptors family 1 profile domain-containing protein n=1 Tax=Henosepilachna vigintioctopunctata TaxID=420089 RepID=A0AAW1UXP8_9CUCU